MDLKCGIEFGGLVAGGDLALTSMVDESGLGALPAKAKCIECGYLLRGLVVARCPECGTGFDPGDATTFVTRPVLGWMGSVALVTAALMNGFIIIGGACLELSAIVDFFLTLSLRAILLEGAVGFVIIAFGLVNFLAMGNRAERLGDPWCQGAIVVDALVLFLSISLMVLNGGIITVVVLVLGVIPAGNVLTFLLIKER